MRWQIRSWRTECQLLEDTASQCNAEKKSNLKK